MLARLVFVAATIALLVRPLFAASSGCVLSINGEPVADAEVRVFSCEGSYERYERLAAGEERLLLASTTSDPAGAFTLERDCEPGDEVHVVAPGFAPFIARPRGASVGSVVLQPAPSVTGRVQTSRGEAVQSAVVYWVNPWADLYWSALTDENGRYEVPDPSRWAHMVMVFHPRLGLGVPRTDDITLERQREPRSWAEIELRETVWTEGTVVGPEGPVARARVVAEGWPVGLTDADGHFRVGTPEDAQIVASHGTMAAMARGGRTELALENGRILNGRVVDTGTDTAIPSARVLISGAIRDRYGALSRQVFTDADGAYTVSGLPATTYTVRVSEPGFVETNRGEEADMRRVESATVTHQVTRQPTARGLVVDADGDAVAGALVMTVPGERFMVVGVPRRRFPELVFTDCGGHFEYWAPNEPFGSRLMVVKKGLVPAVSPGLEPAVADRQLTITLPHEPTVKGIVKGPRGAPVAGVKIAAFGPGYRASGWSPASSFHPTAGIFSLYETSTDGTFEIPVGASQWDLVFSASGLAVATVTDFRALEGDDPLVVILAPLHSLHGRVVRKDGSPVAHAEVLLSDDALPNGTSTDSAGSFTVTDLEPGTHTLHVIDEASGATARAAATVPGSPITVTLPIRYSLAGRVINRASGEPIADAHVTTDAVGRDSVYTRPANTDEEGRFELKGLESGGYELRVVAEGYRRGDRTEVAVGRETARGEITIALDAGLSIAGRISDDRDEPIADAQVSVERSDNADVGGLSTASDEWGAFTLSGLPTGEITFTFNKEGFVPLRRRLELEEDVIDMEVELDRGHQLGGWVEDSRGDSVAAARITARLPGSDDHTMHVQSEDDGSFHLEGMASGTWELTAERTGYEAAEVDGLDPARQESVTLVLSKRPSGSITGTVTGAADPILTRIMAESADRGDSTAHGAVSADGTFRVDDFPAGPVKVSAYSYQTSGTREQTKHADLAPGGEVHIEFDFESGSEVRGRVTRDGQPVFGASLSFYSNVAGSNSAQSDSNGAYTVDLSDGSYQVSVYTLEASSHRRHLDVDGPSILDIELEGVTVTGGVVDRATGEAVAGAEVSIGPRVGGWSSLDESDVRTGSTGLFLFEDLIPIPHLLKATHPDYAQWREVLDLGDGERRELQVVLEKVEGIRVSLVAARAGEQLTGTVVARDMTNALVFDGSPRHEGLAVRLPLPPGVYKISASATGYATRTVQASAPSEEVVIHLTPGGTLLVRSTQPRRRMSKLIMPSGEEYIRCWCNRIAELWLEGPVTSFDNIAAGSYTLVVHEADGATSPYPVTIVEGQRTELSIE